MRRVPLTVAFIFAMLALAAVMAGCSFGPQPSGSAKAKDTTEILDAGGSRGASPVSSSSTSSSSTSSSANLDELRSKLAITEDYHSDFVHGDKGSSYQKYIVLHDTEGDGDAKSVVESWESAGNHVAAHFVVNKDGTIVQCVPIDKIAHHAGFGDTGHNKEYGVEDESRDDKLGTQPIGAWAQDYGMNSYSVGIEMVHVGNGDAYPEEQLVALDNLIAYINAYYGITNTIIDHKMWRSGNADTSAQFAEYLKNYQDYGTHS